jgi:predicted phosphoribosyltransferase
MSRVPVWPTLPVMATQALTRAWPPLFADRADAGRQLADELERRPTIPDPVVVGLARGGVEVAAEVARRLKAPLDVLAVRKIGHPWQPEYALGAVTPDGGVYVRGRDGLTEEQVRAAIDRAQAAADALDQRLHAETAAVGIAGHTALIVDDGLATGATVVAAIRWARSHGAQRVLVAVPVAAAASLNALEGEADEIVCPHPLDDFVAVGMWYRAFEQVDDARVLELLVEARR